MPVVRVSEADRSEPIPVREGTRVIAIQRRHPHTHLMHCREFRRKHDAFIDDTLSGVDSQAMTRHRDECPRCARLDIRVRRALLLAHNLPTIEPSADFAERLQQRLSSERARMMAAQRPDLAASQPWRPLSIRTYAAVAAGLVAAVAIGATVSASYREPEIIRLAPVVASIPEAEPSTLATPTLVASLPGGMGVWPAVFVAQQAPWHFASDAVGR